LPQHRNTFHDVQLNATTNENKKSEKKAAFKKISKKKGIAQFYWANTKKIAL